MEQFRKGERLKLGDQTVTVERLLGVGGQGAVYQVSTKGGPKALKWYLPEFLRMINQKAFYDNLARNVANKAPLDREGRPSKNYLWPEAVSEFQEGNFGYLMDLRPSRFTDAGLYLNGQKNFKDTRTALRAMKTLCKELQLLHRTGYSYQDVNNGNFFIDLEAGDILICDNDNVVPYGQQSTILGKDRYMAPEIVLGTSYPNEDTDLYSASVLLFL